jgi:uncharacterized RDD family membrane protein YckC
MINPYHTPSSQLEADSQGELIRYAGFWARVVASLIDTLLWLLISLPVLFLIYGEGYFIPEIDGSIIVGPIDALINWVLPIVIIITFWVLKQGTPGKILLKMKIIDAKTGSCPTMKQWVIRYLSYIPSTVVLLLGFFWVAWDKKKQGWHDKLAGTVVIFSS